jgi:hypothetical protein
MNFDTHAPARREGATKQPNIHKPDPTSMRVMPLCFMQKDITFIIDQPPVWLIKFGIIRIKIISYYTVLYRI